MVTPGLDAWLVAYGLRARRSRLVARLDCTIHRITPEGARSPADDLALRIYPDDRPDPAPIDAEMEWLLALADDGLHVPRPVTALDGRRVRPWQPDATRPARHAVLLHWLPGRMHDRGLCPRRLHHVGRLTARMHAVADRLQGAGRLTLPHEAFGIDLAAWAGGHRAGAEVLTPGHRRLMQAVAGRLGQVMAAWPSTPPAWGLIHGDLHPWNLLFSGPHAGAIDFSDCGQGLRAMDLASTLQYLRHPLAGNHDHRAVLPALEAALLEGYAAVRPLPACVLAHIDTCVVLRMVGTLEWMLDCWPRLDHRAWGPHFISGSQPVLHRYLEA